MRHIKFEGGPCDGCRDDFPYDLEVEHVIHHSGWAYKVEQLGVAVFTGYESADWDLFR